MCVHINTHILVYPFAITLNSKILIEKLLHSCPEVDKIYLLIRAAKGKSGHERMIDMVSKKPFTIRLTKEFVLSKLVAIESDIAEPNLNLTESDCRSLIKNVSLIFHVAASVKFDATLDVNIRHNVVATQNLLELACRFEKLQCFVHVSTAYSNCQLSNIDERVYPIDVPKDPMSIKITKEMIDNRPNTYTYTKAMAENVATKYASRMNIVIVRPSIVMSSLKEPYEGWIDSINGPVGLSTLGALGILQKIKVNSEVVFDLIPADIVSNALVSIAWACTERKQEFSPGVVRVFNLTTGAENPCSFYHYFSTGREEAYKSPSGRALRPLLKIPKQKGMNPIKYWIHKVFSHLLFAYIVDSILGMLGQKKMVVKAVDRMHHANEMFDYFCSNQWNFVTDNVKKLRDLQSTSDRQTFNCDVRQINWSDYARIGWLGCRRFILKEDDATIEHAKTRYKYICIFYYTVKIMLSLTITFSIGRYLIGSSLLGAALTLAPLYAIIYLL